MYFAGLVVRNHFPRKSCDRLGSHFPLNMWRYFQSPCILLRNLKKWFLFVRQIIPHSTISSYLFGACICLYLYCMFMLLFSHISGGHLKLVRLVKLLILRPELLVVTAHCVAQFACYSLFCMNTIKYFVHFCK